MCCGRNPNLTAGAANRVYLPARPAPPARQTQPTPAPAQPPEFEYTGATALTVVSPITGQKYRFAQPGARVVVNAMDRQWIAFVPHLKRCN